MLVRVRLPPFGNTIFEATIPLSATFIMRQFGCLTTDTEFERMFIVSELHNMITWARSDRTPTLEEGSYAQIQR